MSEKNYYEEKLSEIKALISKEDFQLALGELQAEINMPYIPAVYEPEFKRLYDFVKANLSLNDKQVMTLSRQEVVDLLMSDDEEKELIALEVISEHNLHLEKVTLKKRIQTWNQKKCAMKKTFLLEVLINQKVDIDIQFDENHVLNPAKAPSIIEYKEVQDLFNEIEKLTPKEPTITDASLEEARRFLMITYPKIPECGSELAAKIVKITKFMFNREQELSDEEASIYRLLNEY